MKAKYSHIMNDDLCGITFIYFTQGTVQRLEKGDDVDFGEFCIHMDSVDHKKLEADLRNEPYDCTCFNKLEMGILNDMLDVVRNHFQSYDQPLVPDGSGRLAAYDKPSSMTDREWKEFLEKLQ